MKRYRFNTLLLLIILCFSATQAQQKTKYVVLVSIDGFRPDFYRNKTWPAPNIQYMAERGVSCDGVTGVMPTSTYPSHTSIITGTNPRNHGIYYNARPEIDRSPNEWYTAFADVRVPTLWQAAKEAGLSTASLSWPVSVGAPIDYNVPEIWDGLDRRGASSRNATPKGLFEELVENATGKLNVNDYNLTSLAFDQNLSRMAAYIIRTYKPNLLTIHLPCVDGAQHEHGLEGEEVRRAIAGADHAVSNLLDAIDKAGIKDSTAVFIVGDHGFVNTHTAISPNVWLINNGIVAQGANDWKCRFISAGGTTFFHLKQSNDEETLAKVRRIIDQLPESQKNLFRIIEKEEIKRLGGNADAQFALAAVPGIVFNNTDKELMKSQIGGNHGYSPDISGVNSGLIAFGSGISKNTVVNSMHLVDIAPTIAKLLGLELKNADGIVIPSIIK